MHRYIVDLGQYIQYKIIFGLVASVFTEDFFKLILVFALIEFMDIFTRLLAQSRKCYCAIYPQSPCNLLTCVGFMWQARKWRFIRSTGMRQGCDKMLLYLILLLTSSLVDTALQIGHAPRMLTTIVVVVLSSTEALSILENLSECNVAVIKVIKEKFEQKIK